MRDMLNLPASTEDYAALARRRLPRFLADYIDGGAGAERTLAANLSGWQQLSIRQRVMLDVAGVDTRVRLLGQDSALPVALAPVGLAGMMARRGEVLAARAARDIGIPFVLSTVGVCGIDEVTAAAGAPVWFQLYMMRDRAVVRSLLQRAWKAGCRHLLFTVDVPTSGVRLRDVRSGLARRDALGACLKVQQVCCRPRWLWDVGIHGRPHGFGSLLADVPDARHIGGIAAWVSSQFDPTVTWRDLAWLRDEWKGTLVLKGILDADDARSCVQVGVDGIVVSNHGGRQLDAAPATADKLPEIVAAVDGRLQVFVDGGVRSGADVFKAVALGATGVLVGRPWIWALASRGADGVRALLTAWQRELAVTMQLAGVTRVGDIDSARLERHGRAPGMT